MDLCASAKDNKMMCWNLFKRSPSVLKVGVLWLGYITFNACIADSPSVRSLQVQRENYTITLTMEPPKTASPWITYIVEMENLTHLILSVNSTYTTVSLAESFDIAKCIACELCNTTATPYTLLGKGLTTSQTLISESLSKLYCARNSCVMGLHKLCTLLLLTVAVV